LTIDLIELEEALEGGSSGDYYLLPNSGRIILISSEEMDEESVEAVGLDEEEALPIDPIESRVQFRWMEEFIGTVHSIAAGNALRDSLRHKRPFRNFKDVLMEFPVLRKKWFQFEAMKVKTEAANLLESLDFEILEIVDPRLLESIRKKSTLQKTTAHGRRTRMHPSRRVAGRSEGRSNSVVSTSEGI